MGDNSTQEHILSIALMLVAEAGVAGLNIDTLAQRAGVSRATVYRHVGGRAGIIKRLKAQGHLPEEEADDLQQRILVAARKVFTSRGLSEATVEEVAVEAGVGPATIYRHFGDKGALIERFLTHARLAVQWPDLSDPGADVEDELRVLTRALMPSLVENQDVARLIMSVSQLGGELFTRLRMAPGRTHRRIEAFMAERLDDGRLTGGTPVQLAQAYFGLVFSFSILAPMVAPRSVPADIDQACDFIVAQFLYGAGKSQRLNGGE